jgi:hypothetical protein
MTEDKGKPRKLLDQLADLMNGYLNEAKTDEEKEAALATGLQTLVNFAVLSAFTAGLTEDEMHDVVHDIYTMYNESRADD